jgi:hypothetical protein
MDPKRFRAPFIPKDWKSDPDMVLDFLGTYMSKAFNVSAEVVSKRLRIEKLWPLS